jgi:hypothetical protein
LGKNRIISQKIGFFPKNRIISQEIGFKSQFFYRVILNVFPLGFSFPYGKMVNLSTFLSQFSVEGDQFWAQKGGEWETSS